MIRVLIKKFSFAVLLVGYFPIFSCRDASLSVDSMPIVAVADPIFRPFVRACGKVAIQGPTLFSPDGNFLATFCSDAGLERYTVDVWSWDGDVLKKVFTIHQDGDLINPVYTGAFSPDSRQLLVGTPNGPRLWETATGRLLSSFEGSLFASVDTRAVAFSSYGNMLALFQKDRIYIVDREQERLLSAFQFEDIPAQASFLAFSPQDDQLLAYYGATSGMKATLVVKDISTVKYYFIHYLDDNRDRRLLNNFLQLGSGTFGIAQEGLFVLSLRANDKTNQRFVDVVGPLISEKGYRLPSFKYVPKLPFDLLSSASSMAVSPSRTYFSLALDGNGHNRIPLIYLSRTIGADLSATFNLSADKDQIGASIQGVFFPLDGNRILAVTDGGLYQWNLIRSSM